MRRELTENGNVLNVKLGLNPCFSGICAARHSGCMQSKLYRVLILVLVEYAPRVLRMKRLTDLRKCLNPCFSGICAARKCWKPPTKVKKPS